MDAIVAVYSDWGIGSNGTQPLVISADRAYFQKITKGAAVIVGRTTLADFPGGKPLKDRTNIIISRQDTPVEGALLVHSVEEALETARAYDRCLVIGGATVYMKFFPYIDRIFITKIDQQPECTAFFPNLDRNIEWECTHQGEWQEEKGVRFCFCTYERIRK